MNDMNHDQENTSCIDLGGYYIARMQEAMEEWFSKPREGSHVSDVCLCPRQKVFREIDRLPIDAKTINMYSTGKAIHEAVHIICKHIFAIFSILNREREADVQDRTELTHTYSDKPIAGDEYSETMEEFDAGAINKPREPTVEANQQLIPLTKEKEMHQNLLIQVTGYEQELYEKDQYIHGLENEIRGLKASNHPLIKGENL